MAVHGSVETRTFEADADLSANLYEIVRVTDGAQRINVASEAISTEIVGVLWNKPSAAGEFATVAWSGKGKVRAGAAVSSTGVFLTTNGSGRAIQATSGDIVIGRAMSTAGGDGEIIEAQLDQPWHIGI